MHTLAIDYKSFLKKHIIWKEHRKNEGSISCGRFLSMKSPGNVQSDGYKSVIIE